MEQALQTRLTGIATRILRPRKHGEGALDSVPTFILDNSWKWSESSDKPEN